MYRGVKGRLAVGSGARSRVETHGPTTMERIASTTVFGKCLHHTTRGFHLDLQLQVTGKWSYFSIWVGCDLTQSRDVDQGEQGICGEEAAPMDMTSIEDDLGMNEENTAQGGGEQEGEAVLTDISTIPDNFEVDGEEAIHQSKILEEIIGTTLVNAGRVDEFHSQVVRTLGLSWLKHFYEEQDDSVVNLLSRQHKIQIDEEFIVPVGSGKLRMNTDVTVLDYHLTVGRCIGFSPLLPNVAGAHLFGFTMDLKKPYKDFKGKNAMVGFNPKGAMLYIGTGQMKTYFWQWHQTSFFCVATRLVLLGIALDPHGTSRAILWEHPVSVQAGLERARGKIRKHNKRAIIMIMTWGHETGPRIECSGSEALAGYKAWVNKAPENWKADGFITRNSLIMVTSRYGQNARITLRGHEEDKAATWNAERDYSKVAHLTFALAMSINCTQVHRWDDISSYQLKQKHGDNIYDSPEPNLDSRRPIPNPNEPPCGVLVDLTNIEALFHAGAGMSDDEEMIDGATPPPFLKAPRVDVYPLGFLRTAGNIKATGIPRCFLPILRRINKAIQKENRALADPGEEDEDNGNGGHFKELSPDPIVFPVSCQLYNLITHRTASQSGVHKSQQGSVDFPSGVVIYQGVILPLARAWGKDEVRNVIKDYLTVLKPEVFPQLYDWVAQPIAILIKALYEQERGTVSAQPADRGQAPFLIELVASLERALCYCHTGNAAVLATSLMNPLGLTNHWYGNGGQAPCRFLQMAFKGWISGCCIQVCTGPHLLFILLRASAAMLSKSAPWMYAQMYSPTDTPMVYTLSCAFADVYGTMYTHMRDHTTAYTPALYQAHFRINYSMGFEPDVDYPGLASSYSKRSMHILEVAFRAFFSDTKALVSDSVKHNIASINSQAESPSELKAMSLDARRCESALKSWLKLTQPLDLGDDEGSGAYQLLVNAVVAEEKLIPYGLPNFEGHSMAPSTLAESLVRCASAPTSRPIAPILSRGTFLPTLQVALEAITKMNHFMDKPEFDKFLLQLLCSAIHIFKVQFIPSHKARQAPSPGAPTQTPVFNSWASLGLWDEGQISLHHSSAPSSSKASDVARSHALAFDCHAAWAARPLSLAMLKSVLHKTSLPSDFSLPSSTKAPYAEQTYIWVRGEYDGTKDLHHLAVIISIIASSLLPSLFMPTAVDKSLFHGATSRRAVADIYHGIPWVSRPKKGMVNKSIFMSMITTFIIALYEDQSPLHLQMSTSSKRGLGDAWTSKHSVKGISYTALICLGILWGTGPGAYEKGIFGTDWGCHPPEFICHLHTSIVDKLSTIPFGPFNALTLLIGVTCPSFKRTPSGAHMGAVPVPLLSPVIETGGGRRDGTDNAHPTPSQYVRQRYWTVLYGVSKQSLSSL
ncbi:hypothetical protein BC826DRAFT_974771 [Russula brevipes]|nr:hypothetical protein BC826DRAFT_974771 [Russula brevipes]